MQSRIRVLLLSVLLLQVFPATAGISTSKHNFTSQTASPNAFFWGTRQICVFCHTTHNASPDAGTLWNHDINTGQSYLMYGSNTLDMNQSLTPHEGSLICLSCHDGTIAVNALNNLPGPEGAGSYGTPGGAGLNAAGELTTSSTAFVGTDLRDDHPVGITYNASLDAENGFYPKTGDGAQYPDKLLYDGLYVECTSCHDPHDDTYPNFLIESNANSTLCMRCHNK